MTQTILLFVALFTVTVTAISFYWNDKATKFIVIALFVGLANSIYFSLDGVKGWPAEEPREVKGILASVVVVNPSPPDGEKGGIYISLYPTLPKKWYEYVYPRTAPKTFYVEYSNDRAAKFDLAKKAMEEGKEVRINGIPPMNTSEGEMEEADNSLEGIVSKALKKLLPKQKDTYQPNVPDVEISEQVTPPRKETQ
jgi:hypothetical protein